ncbi:putative quinol monooxygenase [Amycolatopsis jejuensis]|uniref:putative quinol monooxygenase n=1 Tax=Amycolatopsis jejuensis TaxID=330084 RepID=UPI00068D2B25|nr:antibiotic biosynthesis monooxygenase [Amycolatopsis jejuensis]
MTANELRGIARLRFHEGRLEDFRRLAKECIDIMRVKDTGTLQYEIYLSDDESECVFIEHFRDSDALLEHNENVGEVLQAMLATGTVTAELFGTPSDRLKAVFADAPVRFYPLFLSLQRKENTR